jgi:hypothetical protein
MGANLGGPLQSCSEGACCSAGGALLASESDGEAKEKNVGLVQPFSYMVKIHLSPFGKGGT